MNELDKLKLAATVIVLKPAQPHGFEVLLTRRSPAMAFLGGMYCFPGGVMRQEDWSDRALAQSHGLTPTEARAIVGAHFAPRKALGLWLAAIRELFEEVGILLVTGTAGEPILLDKSRMTEIHTALLTQCVSFQTVLETEHLFCDTTRLTYFSHWQTPADVATRFDTHFFFSVLPEPQVSLAHSPEVAHSLWLTPDRALQLFGKAELPMIFPTFAALRALADFDSLDQVLKEFQPRRGR